MFWPEDGTKEYGSIQVELVSDASRSDTASEDQFQQDRQSDDLVERKLKLTKVSWYCILIFIYRVFTGSFVFFIYFLFLFTFGNKVDTSDDKRFYICLKKI